MLDSKLIYLQNLKVWMGIIYIFSTRMLIFRPLPFENAFSASTYFVNT